MEKKVWETLVYCIILRFYILQIYFVCCFVPTGTTSLLS